MRSVIRGAAVCVCAHVGRTLTVLVAVILTCAHANAQSPAISFVQSTQSAPQPLASAVSVQFTAAQNRGNLNVVVVGWHDSSAGVLNVSDSDGNQYLLAVGPTVYPGVATQAMSRSRRRRPGLMCGLPNTPALPQPIRSMRSWQGWDRVL